MSALPESLLAQSAQSRPDRFTRVALGVIAVCLVALTVDTIGAPGASEAVAAQSDQAKGKTGLVSASTQRKEIITKLDRLTAQIGKIETRIADGVEVRVAVTD